jgi:hypothetical protein
MIAEIKRKAGRVDVLVNGAGISINKDINSMTLDDFDLQRAIVRGSWYLTKGSSGFSCSGKTAGASSTSPVLSVISATPARFPTQWKKPPWTPLRSRSARNLQEETSS